MSVHIGTSGWSYDHWEGVLYPHQLPPRSRLDCYIQHYQTVEVNSTYYRWPPNTTFANWRERLPQGFLMTVKAPRGLTHSKRLYSPEQWLERMSEGLQCLGSRLGILLVQLPPQFGCDSARLAYFLEQVPRWIKVAVEFRHPSWHTEEVFSLLERSGAAYCVMSGANLPCILRATASVVYVRLHGPTPTISTVAPTRMMICIGGPRASASGKARGELCSSTSTTTGREMQFGTLQS